MDESPQQREMSDDEIAWLQSFNEYTIAHCYTTFSEAYGPNVGYFTPITGKTREVAERRAAQFRQERFELDDTLLEFVSVLAYCENWPQRHYVLIETAQHKKEEQAL